MNKDLTPFGYAMLVLYYKIRNKLFPIYTGPASVRLTDDQVDIDLIKRHYNVSSGKIYQAERQDRIAYYIIDDKNKLCEVPKNKFVDVTKERNKRLKKIGIK